jgi:hypothetical protein
MEKWECCHCEHHNKASVVVLKREKCEDCDRKACKHCLSFNGIEVEHKSGVPGKMKVVQGAGLGRLCCGAPPGDEVQSAYRDFDYAEVVRRHRIGWFDRARCDELIRTCRVTSGLLVSSVYV